MRGNCYTTEQKLLATKMRRMGKTYSQISKRVGAPKSTLSTWFSKKFPIDKNMQASHLAAIRPLAYKAKKELMEKRKLILEEKVVSSLKTYPLQSKIYQKSLLSMLYWAEGSKYEGVSGMCFVNTDPALLKLFITLVRQSFPIDESRWRVRLHIHYYHKPKQTLQYWSKTLKIPLSLFAKPYVKKRSLAKKFRKNFMGICLLRYLNSDIRKELMEIGKQLGVILAKTS